MAAARWRIVVVISSSSSILISISILITRQRIWRGYHGAVGEESIGYFPQFSFIIDKAATAVTRGILVSGGPPIGRLLGLELRRLSCRPREPGHRRGVMFPRDRRGDGGGLPVGQW
jgi:hypothetical protein